MSGAGDGNVWHRVAIFGSGQLGSAIAYVCAAKQLRVDIYDHSTDALNRCRNSIKRWFDKAVSSGSINMNDSIRTQSQINYKSPANLDLTGIEIAIEAIPENLELKSALFQELVRRCDSSTVLASNTSSFSITRLGKISGRPESVVGIHFMNPAHTIPLVEIVPGLATSEETFMRAQSFVDFIGKTGVLAKDIPGFFVNRLLIPMINDAAQLVDEGHVAPSVIDRSMKLGANMPMGPLELADFIGLDTVLAIMETLQSQTGDSRYRPAMILRRYVDAGWLGRKTSKGFFSYGR